MEGPPPKKESWWKKLIPKCGSSDSKPKNSVMHSTMAEGQLSSQVRSEVTLKCLSCGIMAEVGVSASAFVCKNCHKVHRVSTENFGTNDRRLSIVESSEEPVITLVRTSSTTFIPVGESPDIEARPSEPVVPQCQVCMDGPGDIVLLPCSHGAICEACAKHIARNLSVGGNHCVKCREEIRDLVRLSELYTDHATGVSVDVPLDSVRKGPPKVPPPPGLNKSKNDRNRSRQS